MSRLLVGPVFLLVVLPGLPAADPAPPDRDVLLAFAREPLVFDPFVFTGPAFPPCEFEHPERVAKLVGPYTLHTTFYDEQGRRVSAPGKAPGRYAAVVEIRRPGRVSKRFFTLFHRAGNSPPGLRATGAALTLPRGTGIDPAALPGQQEDVDDLASQTLTAAARKDPAAAALLAGLHDLSRFRAAGKAAADDRASHRERQWWVDFKRRSYGYDRLYPEKYVCPTPLEGKPAPVVRDGPPAEAGVKPGAAAAIDAAAEKWVKENGVGFAVCVVCRGVVVVDKGYGEWEGKPVAADTPAVLASTTKFLNAVLLMGMVDRGLVRLDDPVEKHVAAMRGVTVPRPMTVRDLYLHTSGLTGTGDDARPDFEEWVADQYPALEVGVRHRYGAAGLALGSKIMEMISGEALPYLYRDHLFAPLGCTRARADYVGFGSRATARDLARVGQMALNGGSYGDKRFFGPATLAQCLPVPGKDRIGDDKSIRWGVGIKAMDVDGLGEKAFGHPGGSGSFLLIDLSRELVIGLARMSEGNNYEAFLRQKAAFLAAVAAAVEPAGGE
jgi:CubicO group peptidase (beta-lactamase class C family)